MLSVQGADEGEKGFVDQTKEFVAGFDEEKEKLLELQGKTDIFYTEPSLFIHLFETISTLRLESSELPETSYPNTALMRILQPRPVLSSPQPPALHRSRSRISPPRRS